MLAAWLVLGLAAAAAGCELTPDGAVEGKSPGDNFYRVVVNGEIERYIPGQRYVGEKHYTSCGRKAIIVLVDLDGLGFASAIQYHADENCLIVGLNMTLVGTRTHDYLQQFTRFKLSLEPLDPAVGRSPRMQGQFQLFADTISKFDEECSNAVIEADDLPKTEVQVMWKAPATGSGCVLLKAMVHESSSRWFAEDGQLTKRICEDTSVTAPDCCACDDAKYKMVFEGLWSPQTHPKDFPTQALWLTHFSDIIGATHPKNFTFWGEGQIASDGFRSLAEWGSPGALEIELRQQGRVLRSIVKAAGLWHPRVNGNTSAAFTVDRRRNLLSLASMFGPSPDWVVGVSGLNLCQKDCSWVEKKVIDLFPYDAGTDNGISYLSPNSETVPREKMYRITPMYPEDPRAPFYNPGGTIAPMARLYLTRELLIPRGCDEEVLQALVVEEAENTQSVNRPECAVTEWTDWSACSVTCGKGLRMRTREYRMPQKAQMFSCDRQLVSKEMCVADVPECEAETGPTLDSDVLPVEDIEGLCATTEWGQWSECSVTCGVGVSTRRRQFLNHMGYKKCTLVPTEENRKCMEPQCTEQERDISDPTCPTTEWAGWSPCSASCGRGVRFRTRLLLVPADMQQECSSKVELMQQRPCTEQEDCTIDMPTAKRICMELPETGPCRGLYQRWAFVAMKGMCVPFNYGGCRGNRNNFISQEDCMSTCRILLGGGAPGSAVPASGQLTPTVSSNYPGLTISAIVPLSNSVDGPTTNDCRLSAWSEWSRCSVTCGSGYQEKTRSILSPAGPGGVPCSNKLARRRRCFRNC